MDIVQTLQSVTLGVMNNWLIFNSEYVQRSSQQEWEGRVMSNVATLARTMGHHILDP